MKIAIIALVLIAVAGGIVYFLKQRSTTQPEEKPEFSEEEYNRHHEAKQAALERILGPMHYLVGHASIPFQIGGAVDMYYFPNGISGTGFATMELIEPDGSGPKPNRIGTYELVAFTKLTDEKKAYDILPRGEQRPDKPEEDKKAQTPFDRIQRRMCGILTTTGFYSYEAILNPGETCEVPGGDGEPNKCLIFDEYAPEGKPFEIDGKKHCLLLCLEVFRSEMEYAMEHGSGAVLQKLKEAGHYPYSDLDREPVY